MGDYFNAHTSGTLYLPDATYQIELFACVQVDAYDSVIYDPVGPERRFERAIEPYQPDCGTEPIYRCGPSESGDRSFHLFRVHYQWPGVLFGRLDRIG